MMSMNDPFRGVSAIFGARKRRELRGAEQRLAAACRMKPLPPRAPCGCGVHDIVSGIAASPAKIGTTSLCLAPSPLSSSVVHAPLVPPALATSGDDLTF
jgi:hypothetical protein